MLRPGEIVVDNFSGGGGASTGMELGLKRNVDPVDLAWFSPDCKHFSTAKGATPVNKHIRGLAWVAVRWAVLVPVRMIMLENVEEFLTWEPVLAGKPCRVDRH